MSSKEGVPDPLFFLKVLESVIYKFRNLKLDNNIVIPLQ